jgi:hypothetical protein
MISLIWIHRIDIRLTLIETTLKFILELRCIQKLQTSSPIPRSTKIWQTTKISIHLFHHVHIAGLVLAV